MATIVHLPPPMRFDGADIGEASRESRDLRYVIPLSCGLVSQENDIYHFDLRC
jgi:hypothetical protein